jgi:carbamoyl-phosphate synthase large subunit
MPKREDLKKIMLIGSGPIIIGQACEFDYSGTQACKALKEEGYEIILVNSNPATIMTDPQISDRTYIEPLTVEVLEKIIAKERPDALLPTIGGQTALNLTVALVEKGIIDKYKVELIGANFEAIKRAEDRSLFKRTMQDIGMDLPRSGYAHNLTESLEIARQVGFPLVIRPSFTLGGTGGSIAYNIEEFMDLVTFALEHSPVSEVLIEESVLGWKEFELEVMRDKKDNVVIVCSIENFDPMGIHTGDSITVAPAQTLSDKEYQRMRDASVKIIRAIGVDTGGSNIQFGVNPLNGRMVVIEMNPRVSRSSALASKATGFPIAKIAAKLAVGYTLDEIPNDITKKTPACFEPSIDYVVTKIPRFAFEKFAGADSRLGISMKSVGEVMAIGRTFKESLQKAIRGLEIGRHGLGNDNHSLEKEIKTALKSSDRRDDMLDTIKQFIKLPTSERIFYIKYALQNGFPVADIAMASSIDPWFIYNIKELCDFEMSLRHANFSKQKKPQQLELLMQAKKLGYADYQLAELLSVPENLIFRLRQKNNLYPSYKLVDTCAAEFQAYTPYYYSTYDNEDEQYEQRSKKKKIMILGGGPNRIGQGIEFDYCCVHAAFALKDMGYETIMVNCNPETVSTDYDTSDRLYFEPVTLEDVLNINHREKPDGVIVQFGGQTPLNLALALKKNGVKIIGTSPDNIDLAEDRKRFGRLLNKLKIPQAENGTAMSFSEAKAIAAKIGYPVMVRPSYVLGGRAMEIVYEEPSLENYIRKAKDISPKHPILIDKFLSDAIEVDCDAVSDGKDVYIGGIMEHIEEAGIHSGDSACALPPYTLTQGQMEIIRTYTTKLAKSLQVIGLLNIQYAIKDDIIYVLEVNPRASRTVPFVSKATGIPLAKIAAACMVGKKLKDLPVPLAGKSLSYTAVKEAVLPFIKFPGIDSILGPEMKSTGEVMGIDANFGLAFAKSQMAAGSALPLGGTVFLSVNDRDKQRIAPVAKKLLDLGFKLISTRKTCAYLKSQGFAVEEVAKIGEGRPDMVDIIKNKQVDLIINTPKGTRSRSDGYVIRQNALIHNVPFITTFFGAEAAVDGIVALRNQGITVKPIQEYYK